MKQLTRKFQNRLVLTSIIIVFFIVLAIYIFALILHSYDNSKVKKVIGIDVSSYQGEIDWPTIEDQGIYFAYIKATEGSDILDSRFEENWENIDKTGMKKGAYLFYNFNEDGERMADFFIENVPVERDSLPPSIDVELDQQTAKAGIDKTAILNNIKVLSQELKETYNKNPIIYTNIYTYNELFTDQMEDTEFWICDLDSNIPDLGDHNWVFWQYTWRGILNGIGEENQFVDMNLYNGNLKEFYDNNNPSFFETITTLGN